MKEQTFEEIVGRLSDFDVLDILLEVVELEGILFQKAKADGHGITYDENSTYFLYFGELIEEMGAERLMIQIRGSDVETRRVLLVTFLGFNHLMASLQVEEPEREIFCASLNMSEVLRAGVVNP